MDKREIIEMPPDHFGSSCAEAVMIPSFLRLCKADTADNVISATASNHTAKNLLCKAILVIPIIWQR